MFPTEHNGGTLVVSLQSLISLFLFDFTIDYLRIFQGKRLSVKQISEKSKNHIIFHAIPQTFWSNCIAVAVGILHNMDTRGFQIDDCVFQSRLNFECLRSKFTNKFTCFYQFSPEIFKIETALKKAEVQYCRFDIPQYTYYIEKLGKVGHYFSFFLQEFLTDVTTATIFH